MASASSLLLIDDDALVRRAVSRWFKNRGWSVIVAPTGMAASSLNDPVACAVFDIDLPDGSGIDFAAALLESGRVPHVVFFSSTGSAQLRARAERYGTFVPKAAGIAELSAVVDEIRNLGASGVVVRRQLAKVMP